MLSVDTAPDYLLERGLISRQTILDGDLDIVSVTRRNANLQVTTRNHGGYLLKQPMVPEEAFRATLRTEARFYGYCREMPELEELRKVLPRLLAHDLEQGLLIVEFLDNTLPLWRYYRESTANHFPVEVALKVGQLLGRLHCDFSRIPGERHPEFLSADYPWALNLVRPTPDTLSRISAAHYDLIKLLQAEDEVTQTIDRLRRGWQANTIIHGDVKMDNFLVRPSALDGQEALFLIDWELVQLGDPAWDIAGALQDFVFWWVLNMPHEKSPEEMVTEARFPLTVLQPGIIALWKGYQTSRKWDAEDSKDFLDRAVLYSAVRILQTAAEIASKYQTLPAPAVLMSQIGVNLLKAPELAREELYGLTESTEE